MRLSVIRLQKGGPPKMARKRRRPESNDDARAVFCTVRVKANGIFLWPLPDSWAEKARIGEDR